MDEAWKWWELFLPVLVRALTPLCQCNKQQYRDFQGNPKELGASDSNNRYSISLTVYNLSASQDLLQMMKHSLFLNRPERLFSLSSPFTMRRAHPLRPELEHVVPTWSAFLQRSAQVDALILALPIGALISSCVPRWWQRRRPSVGHTIEKLIPSMPESFVISSVLCFPLLLLPLLRAPSAPLI